MKSKLFRNLGFQLIGVLVAVALWHGLTQTNLLNEQFSHGFSPANTAKELTKFLSGPEFLKHTLPSLRRVGVGLMFATLVGIPVGILVGYFNVLNLLTNTVFQFIRMTSPLAWMPLAIIVLGVGDRPVYFLISIAAVWPMIINTAHGVRNVNPNWVKVVRMLGGHHWGVLRRVVIPAIIPDMLNGLRISIGISWIILVPAEMLGVSSGLGYYILDTRDRFNYGELMAVILIVGSLGFLSDLILRIVQRKLSWRKDTIDGLVR